MLKRLALGRSGVECDQTWAIQLTEQDHATDSDNKRLWHLDEDPDPTNTRKLRRQDPDGAQQTMLVSRALLVNGRIRAQT